MINSEETRQTINLNFLHTYCLELNVMLGELLFQERNSPENRTSMVFCYYNLPFMFNSSWWLAYYDSKITPQTFRIAPQNPYVTLTRGELEDIYDAVESTATLRSVKRARQDPLLDKNRRLPIQAGSGKVLACAHDLLIKAARYRRETLQEGPGLRDRDVIGPLLGLESAKPNLNDIRAISPTIWAIELSRFMALWAMKQMGSTTCKPCTCITIYYTTYCGGFRKTENVVCDHVYVVIIL